MINASTFSARPINGYGVAYSQGEQIHSTVMVANSDAVNALSSDGYAINGTGVAYSQGEQYFETLIPNSLSINSKPVERVANELGVAFDQTPKHEGAFVTVAQQSITLADVGEWLNIQNIIQRLEPSGALLNYPTNIGWTGEGQLFYIEQDIPKPTKTPATSILDIEQVTTRSADSNLLFVLSQRVIDSTIEYRAPFDIDIVISSIEGAWTVPQSMLCEDINISRSENSSALMDFTLVLDSGEVDTLLVEGRDVTLNYTDNATGQTYTVFSGIVDYPEINLIEGRATIHCTDSRQERLDALDASVTNGIGYFSTDVFGEVETVSEELEKRLETIPYSLDFDREGVLRITPFAPDIAATINYSDSTIYRRDPKVTIQSRSSIINKVNLNINFEYQRLRNRIIPYRWDWNGIDGAFPRYNYLPSTSGGTASKYCFASKFGYPPKNTMVIAAIESAGRYRNYERLAGFVGGGADCVTAGSSIYTRITTRTYKTEQVAKKEYIYIKDEGWVERPVKDASGNQVYENKITGYTDYSNSYAVSAKWDMQTVFAQNITEQIKIEITAPQSQAQYNKTIEKDLSCTVRLDADLSKYEDSDSWVLPTFEDGTEWPLSPNGDYYIDYDNYADESGVNGLNRYHNAFKVMAELAKTEIIKAHRQSSVQIHVPFNPTIGLHHSISTVGSEWIEAWGKVSQITHRIDVVDKVADSIVTFNMRRTSGEAPANSTLSSSSSRPDVVDDAVLRNKQINLKPYLLTKDQKIDSTISGYVYRSNDDLNETGAPIAFVVDIPEIEDSSRNQKIAVKSSILELPLSNDTLRIIIE